MIKQQKRNVCNEEVKIRVTAEWCNYGSEDQAISPKSRLRLSGPASDAAHETDKPFDIEGIEEKVLPKGECQKMMRETKISDCEAYFNYEVHINPTDMCRGYFFERQMLRLCHLGNEITCEVADGTGKFQDCKTYNPCSLATCDCAGKGCVRRVAYRFDYSNKNVNPLLFDLSPDQYMKVKIDGEIVNDYIFPDRLFAKDIGRGKKNFMSKCMLTAVLF